MKKLSGIVSILERLLIILSYGKVYSLSINKAFSFKSKSDSLYQEKIIKNVHFPADMVLSHVVTILPRRNFEEWEFRSYKYKKLLLWKWSFVLIKNDLVLEMPRFKWSQEEIWRHYSGVTHLGCIFCLLFSVSDDEYLRLPGGSSPCSISD